MSWNSPCALFCQSVLEERTNTLREESNFYGEDLAKSWGSSYPLSKLWCQNCRITSGGIMWRGWGAGCKQVAHTKQIVPTCNFPFKLSRDLVANHLGQWLTTGLFPMDNPRRKLDEWTLGLPSLTSSSFQAKTSLPSSRTGDKERFAEMIYHNNKQLVFFFVCWWHYYFTSNSSI